MQLVFFLEEASAKALLQELLPRLLPAHITPFFVVFEGKQDLEKQLPRKLRAWQRPECRFVVLRDRDGGDCRIIKERLKTLCREGGKEDVLIRIVCRELESWYLGDLAAVTTTLEAESTAARQNSRKFRDPDALDNPKQELKKLVPSYEQIAGSRQLGRVMDLQHNLSHSFNCFLSGLQRIVHEQKQ
ncbi:MAG: DUF4276 family protein [Magnetococcales bacterium]|nr:DUF4276 family protein [Magnetococcales bacterium]